MKRFFVVFAFVFVICVSNTIAQQDFTMLRSKDLLRVSMVEQSAYIMGCFTSTTPSDSDSCAYVPISEPSDLNIEKIIAYLNLVIKVINPKENVYTYAGVYNKENEVLFFGTNNFRIVPNGSGGFSLPDNYGSVDLNMVNNVPIPFKGAQSAIVTLLNSEGESIGQYQIDVFNEKILLPRQLAGENAILSIFTNNGWVHIDIREGSIINPQTFKATINARIVGIKSIIDSHVNIQIPTTDGIGQNITAELTSTKHQWVKVHFDTTEGKLFKGALIKKAGVNEEWVQRQLFVGRQDFEFPAEQNVIYYIIPIWDPQDLTEPPDPWYPPYNGGKG